MNLVRFIRVALVLVELALLSGCATATWRTPTERRPRTLALAVAVTSGEKPTPAQWAVLETGFARIIAPSDRLVHNVAGADEVIHISFTPDAAGSAGGHAVIVAVVPNDPFSKPYPWNRIIDPETNPRAFELIMDAVRTP